MDSDFRNERMDSDFQNTLCPTRSEVRVCVGEARVRACPPAAGLVEVALARSGRCCACAAAHVRAQCRSIPNPTACLSMQRSCSSLALRCAQHRPVGVGQASALRPTPRALARFGANGNRCPRRQQMPILAPPGHNPSIERTPKRLRLLVAAHVERYAPRSSQ
jgi:hypothetical protein